MKNIASALVKAQREFGPALKTHTNPAFRSKYADLSACVEAVIDALNNNGIFLTQHVSDHTDGVIVETVFLHESGERLDCGKLFVPATKKDAQGFGSAETYARRYSLMAACGIAPEDDDGAAASKRPAAAPRHSPTMNALDALPENEREPIRDLAMEVIAAFREGIDAQRAMVAGVEAQRLDDAQKTALWSLLDSTTRTAYKKVAQPAKAEA